MEHIYRRRIGVEEQHGVRTAREAVAEVVAHWELRATLAEEAALVVSELVTNALAHAGSDAHLQLTHQGDRLRVEVADADTRLPVVVAPDRQLSSGRGMALVASLATQWGAERTASGKVVWAEFDASDP